ncbi:hypothetical protein [Brevibacillus sp. NRS-1366]|uniref:hypothetical protein n=1 Tax=Brevibacillus sp. NRS-1366 TaxID=3233899 RepID=UPI003D20FF1B
MQIVWVIGKLVLGIFLSCLYVNLLFHNHVFEFSLFAVSNRNMNFFFPALLSGPFLVFFLSSRKWSVLGVVLLSLMVILPSMDIYRQAELKAQEERIDQEETRRRLAGEQAALPLLTKVYPGEINTYEFNGGPWGDCTTLLARVEGNHGTILYDYDVVQNRIVGLITHDSFKAAVQKYLPGAKDVHITKDGFGTFEFTYNQQGKEREGTAFIENGCQPLAMVSILFEGDDDYHEIPAPHVFAYKPE